MLHTAVLLTGSNKGDRLNQLLLCSQLLEQFVGKIEQMSSVYETAAWGNEELPPHLNQALVVTTLMEPLALLYTIGQVEHQLGRVRQEKWGLRTIDIDIIYFDNDVVVLPQLIIPHPLMQDRKFVLTPICEILPNFVHPVFNIANDQLLLQCNDPLSVISFSNHSKKNSRK